MGQMYRGQIWPTLCRREAEIRSILTDVEGARESAFPDIAVAAMKRLLGNYVQNGTATLLLAGSAGSAAVSKTSDPRVRSRSYRELTLRPLWNRRATAIYFNGSMTNLGTPTGHPWVRLWQFGVSEPPWLTPSSTRRRRHRASRPHRHGDDAIARTSNDIPGNAPKPVRSNRWTSRWRARRFVAPQSRMPLRACTRVSLCSK